MAKAPKEGGQVAQCVKVHTYKRDGEIREIYTLSLEGKEFTLFQSDYFKAELGHYYSPVIDITPKGYLGKDGRPYAQNSPVVNWAEA